MLTDAQRAAAESLLANRPAVIPGTRVIVNVMEKDRWYTSVTDTIREIRLPMDRVNEFCDVAGVAD